MHKKISKLEQIHEQAKCHELYIARLEYRMSSAEDKTETLFYIIAAMMVILYILIREMRTED